MISDGISYIEAQIKALGIKVVQLDQFDKCRSGVTLFLTGGETTNCLSPQELYQRQNMVIQLKGDIKSIKTLNQIESIRDTLHNTYNVDENSTRIISIYCQPFVSISRSERTDYSMVVSVQYK